VAGPRMFVYVDGRTEPCAGAGVLPYVAPGTIGRGRQGVVGPVPEERGEPGGLAAGGARRDPADPAQHDRRVRVAQRERQRAGEGDQVGGLDGEQPLDGYLPAVCPGRGFTVPASLVFRLSRQFSVFVVVLTFLVFPLCGRAADWAHCHAFRLVDQGSSSAIHAERSGRYSISTCLFMIFICLRLARLTA
jgi:hypothetical protein